MNKEQKTMRELADANIYGMKQIVNNAPFDKTVDGIVTAINSTEETYNVEINQTEYTNIPSFVSLNIGDVVKVKIEQNNYTQMYIIGKYNQNENIENRIETIENYDIFYGSAILWPNIIDVSDNNRHNLLTSGSGGMIDSLFREVSTPKGFRKCFRLSSVLSTNKNGTMVVGFNGKPLVSGSTWSKNTFVISHVSNKFRDWTEFPTEKADGYEYNGLNLYYQLNSPSETGRIYSITLLGYFEKINN